MERALYDPEHGFYATGGRAGRRGDFLTSVEVGPLFGAVLARALDTWWKEAGSPRPFVVVEAGAGSGTLARSVLRAEPACAAALRYVLVERSASLRAAHDRGLPLTVPAHAFAAGRDPDEEEEAPRRPVPDGPIAVSLATLPPPESAHVVLANELLDNLPVRILERSAEGWAELGVGDAAAGETAAGQKGALVEVLLPSTDVDPRVDAAPGARVAWQTEAAGGCATRSTSPRASSSSTT